MIEQAINDSVKLIEKNWKELAIDFSKIYGLTYVFSTIFTGAMIAVWVVAGIGSGENPWLAIAIGIAVTILMSTGLVVITGAISATSFLVVRESTAGKRVGIIEKSRELLVPVGKYMLLLSAVGVLVLAVILLPLVAQDAWVSVLLMLTLMAVMVIALVLLFFFIQFAMLEIVIGKKGVIDSLRLSTGKVRNNIIMVFLYDIILFVISIAIGIPFSLVIQFVVVPMMIASALNIGFLMVAILLYLALLFIMSVGLQVIVIPITYFFWKRLK